MLGKTQAQMAEMFDISPQSYHNKECGKVQFTSKEMLTFKKMLLPFFPDITIEDIFF
jgi:putative transcriptional regulator